MTVPLISGDLIVVFPYFTVGKRPQHGGAQLLAVSLWGARCSSAQGRKNLENQDGGNWFIINPQQ